MNRRHVLVAGALLCLIGMVAVPVAAVPSPLNTVKNATIDPGLKEDFWNIHTDQRLARFDQNVELAGKVIAALENHGYNTSNLTNILDSISENRDALSTALHGKDKEALKTINSELSVLWKDFRHEVRDLLKGR